MTTTDFKEENDWDPQALTRKQAAAIVNADSFRFKVIEEDIVDQRRWDTLFEVVILDKLTNKHYCTEFSRGSTFQEVEQREVSTLQWVPVV